MWRLSISASGAVVAILAAMLLWRELTRARIRSTKMAEIAAYIAIGIKVYLSRQRKTILVVAPLLALVIYPFLGPWVALTFVLGVVTSLTTASLGMDAAARANVKTAEDATVSPKKAFLTAVFGGSIMGFSVVGFSILALSLLYLAFQNANPLIGFGFGASLAALFAQIGGGIYTKAADVGADLVGKVEENIPEDDPRNPAVIADLVGDNVGDCAGRGSDLFETVSDDIVTGMVVAAALIAAGRYVPQTIFFPLILQTCGLIASVVGVLSMRRLGNLKPETAFNVGLLVTTVLAVLGSYLTARFLVHDMSMLLASSLGILITLVAAFVTRYYAGINGKPVRDMAEACKRGAALNIMTGIGYGLQSPLASVVIIAIAVSVAYVASGQSLLAIVAVNIGTDLLVGYIVTADAFGPITDNATGIAEMSGAGEKAIHALSSLDAVGNTMKATTKAYAMSSGTVTSFVLFATFFSLAGLDAMDVSRPFSVAFVFVGMMLPYLIASLVIGSTAKTAQQMVDEVRRQFRDIRGLMEGTAQPDYASCVDISTRNALREMVLPGVLSVAIPAVAGLAFGARALGSLLIGAVAAAALLGSFLNNLGTAFDNAKKLIETRGVKGTFEHQAAVIGDTVGDPLKDVAGPSLLILMKLLGMAALLIVNLVRKVPWGIQ